MALILASVSALASPFFFFWAACRESGDAASMAAKIASASQLRCNLFPFPPVIRIQFTPRTFNYRLVRSLWQVAQNLVLFSWSFTSKFACKEECGWWQVKQVIFWMSFVKSDGSATSETGCPARGWPLPYLSGSTGTLFFL